MNLNTFVTAYLETAVWSDLQDEDKDHKGFSQEAIDRATYNCARFIEQNIDDINASGKDEGKIAHDFWLTRNGHGAGFWDGDYAQDIGDRLTESAHSFGNVDIYMGDDGYLYFL